MFILGNVCLSTGGGGRYPTRSQSQMGGWGTPSPLDGVHHPSQWGYPILLDEDVPTFLPMGEYPCQNWMGVPPPGLDGYPPPHQGMDGIVMLRAVRLLRFPAGGLSCFTLYLSSKTLNDTTWSQHAT